MSQNGKWVYGTRPWKTDREILEKTTKDKVISDNETENEMKDAVNDATSKLIIPEVRFLSKGDNLIAFVCSFRNKSVLIKSLAIGASKPIKKVELIGYKKNAKWNQTAEGLLIDMPLFAIPEIPIVGFNIVF
jgi:alpha-L-fucosidase